MYPTNPGMYDHLVSMGYTGPERGTDEFAALRAQGQRPYRDFRQQWRQDHPGEHMGLGGLGWQNWQPNLPAGMAQYFQPQGHPNPFAPMNPTPPRPMGPGIAVGEPNPGMPQLPQMGGLAGLMRRPNPMVTR